MKLIFQLGKYIVIPLLLEWLDLSAFGDLCVAAGSLESHDKFLALIEGYSALFYRAFLSSVYVPLSLSALRWFERLRLDFPDKIILDSKVAAKYTSSLGFVQSVLTGRYSDHQKKSALVLKCLKGVHSVRLQSMPIVLRPYLLNIELSLVLRRLSFVLPLCGPFITVFDMSGAYRCDKLYDMVIRFPNLSVLKLASIAFRLNLTLLRALTVYCRKLSVLDVRVRTGLSQFLHRDVLSFLLHSNCRIDNALSTVLYSRIMFARRADVSTLVFFFGVSDELAKLVAEGNHKLTSLWAKRCSVKELEVIVASCPLLRKCYLSHTYFDIIPLLDVVSSHLEDLELRFIHQSPQIFNYPFPRLRRLILMHCNLTNSHLQQFLNWCPALTALSVEHNDEIDDAIGEMSKAYNGLTALNLSMCRRITNECMFLLARHCVNLRELHIEHCKFVTDEGLSSVLINGKMRYLDLYGCKDITLETVQCIAQYCKGIETLNLKRTKADPAIAAKLLKGCPRLRFDGAVESYEEACKSDTYLGTP